MIIDETEEEMQGEISNTPGNVLAHSNTTARQQMLLMYMQSMGCPVFSINNGLASSNLPDDTLTPIKGLYNGREDTVLKKYFNAFKDTRLHHELKTSGIY